MASVEAKASVPPKPQGSLCLRAPARPRRKVNLRRNKRNCRPNNLRRNNHNPRHHRRSSRRMQEQTVRGSKSSTARALPATATRLQRRASGRQDRPWRISSSLRCRAEHLYLHRKSSPWRITSIQTTERSRSSLRVIETAHVAGASRIGLMTRFGPDYSDSRR